MSRARESSREVHVKGGGYIERSLIDVGSRMHLERDLDAMRYEIVRRRRRNTELTGASLLPDCRV